MSFRSRRTILATVALAIATIFAILMWNSRSRVTRVGEGVSHEVVRHAGQSFRVVRVELSKAAVQSVWKRDDESRFTHFSDGSGNFFLKPNGVFAIGPRGASVTETSAESLEPGAITAIQSGPMLLRNDVINEQFAQNSSNRAVRSAVGVSNEHPTVVVFVLSTSSVTFYELASLFRDKLNCANALYLDGTISRFFVAGMDVDDESGPFASMVVVARP